MRANLVRQKSLILLLGAVGLGIQTGPGNANTASMSFANPPLTGGNGSLDIAGGLGLLPGTAASFSSGFVQFAFTAPELPAYYGGSSTVFNYQQSGYYNSSCGFGCGGYVDNYYTQTNYYNEPAQWATAGVGAGSVTSYSPSNTSTVYAGNSGYIQTVSGLFNYYNYYNYYNTTTSTAGSFSATLGLDSSALSGLNGTGSLAFTLGFSNSGISFDSAYFYGTYDVVASTAAVPEPETYAMLLAGLGLLGFAARRRRVQQSRG